MLGQFNLLGIPNIAGLVSALLHTKSFVTYVVVLYSREGLTTSKSSTSPFVKVVFPIGKCRHNAEQRV